MAELHKVNPNKCIGCHRCGCPEENQDEYGRCLKVEADPSVCEAGAIEESND